MKNMGQSYLPRVYEYFPNKQALLFALAERHIELADLLDMALVALQSPDQGDSPLQLTDAPKAPESPSNL